MGGMGRVYRARGPEGHLVAVKVANPAIENSPALTRFINESLLTLNHPNLLRVLEGGSDGGTPYLVYKLVEGEPVDRILRNGPMTSDEVVAMGVQLCAGLAAAHRAGGS
ncbi:MAG: protein kinase [Myxococcales bacterium]|nr:protein kinase [Myxococcales bacterium]